MDARRRFCDRRDKNVHGRAGCRRRPDHVACAKRGYDAQHRKRRRTHDYRDDDGLRPDNRRGRRMGQRGHGEPERRQCAGWGCRRRGGASRQRGEAHLRHPRRQRDRTRRLGLIGHCQRRHVREDQRNRNERRRAVDRQHGDDQSLVRHARQSWALRRSSSTRRWLLPRRSTTPGATGRST